MQSTPHTPPELPSQAPLVTPSAQQPTPAHWRGLFDMSPTPMVFCTAQRVLHVNASAMRLLGCRPGDEVQAACLDAAQRQALCEAIARGEPAQVHALQLRAHDGSTHSCEATVAPWHWQDVDGDSTDGLMVWLADVTERLREAQRLQNIARVAHDWFWETDELHRFTYVSTADEHTQRVMRQSLSGKTRWELPGPPQQALWTRHRTLLDARQPFRDFEYEITTVDGHTRWISSSGLPVWSDQGQFLGYQGVSVDITERRLQEADVHEVLKEARAAAERMLDFVHLGVDRYWETDTDHRFVEVWGRGGVAEEVRRHWLGRRPWEIVPPTDEHERRAVDECRRLVQAHQPLVDFEYSLTPSAGTRYWISISAKPLFDADGRFLGYRGCNSVITDRKQREAERERLLREIEVTHQRVNDYARSAAEWFWETDAEHRFSEFAPHSDPAYRDLQRRVIGLCRWQLPGPEQEALWAQHRKVLDAHQPFSQLEYAAYVGSELRWISASGVPVFDDQGQFSGYRGSAIEVTERKRQEAALRDALQQAEAAHRVQSTLLATINRDLRTPMTNVVGLTALLLDDASADGSHHASALGADQREALAIVQDSVQAMLKVVDRLVDGAAGSADPGDGPRAALTSRTGS